MAMMLDYLENITFSVIILLYPSEWMILAYLGVLMSLLKWIALGVSLMSVTVLSVVVLFQTIVRTLKSRKNKSL
jgi:Zn-dependent membrane protease YugP